MDNWLKSSFCMLKSSDGGFQDTFRIRALLFVLLCSQVLQTTADFINNGIVGTPIINCLDDRMTFSFQTEREFQGRVFVKGRSEDRSCVKNFFNNTRRDAVRESSYALSLGECGMQRFRAVEPLGMTMSVTMVISFHPLFITAVDRAYKLNCLFRVFTKTVTQSLDVSMLQTTALVGSADPSRCSYSLKRGQVDGPEARFALIGETVVHVWQCYAGTNMGLLVYNCETRDDGGLRIVPIVDEFGCALDTVLLDQIQYDDTQPLATASSHVYKYADKSSIYFFCSLRLCNKAAGECNGVTPPRCQGNRRSVDLLRYLSNEFSLENFADAVKESMVSSSGNNTIVQPPQFLPQPSDVGFGFPLKRVARSAAEQNSSRYILGRKFVDNFGSLDPPIDVATDELYVVDRSAAVWTQFDFAVRSSSGNNNNNRSTLQPNSSSESSMVKSYSNVDDNDFVDRFPGPCVPSSNERQAPEDVVCVPPSVFAIMATSTVLSFVLVTILTAILLARSIAKGFVARGPWKKSWTAPVWCTDPSLTLSTSATSNYSPPWAAYFAQLHRKHVNAYRPF